MILTPTAYVKTIEQRLRNANYELRYDTNISGLRLDLIGIKRARPIIDAFSKIFALTTQQTTDPLTVSAMVLGYSARFAPWKLASFARSRIVVPVFVNQEFSAENKAIVRRMTYQQYAAVEIPVLVEVKNGQQGLIFNRDNQLWGWAVLPKIIKSIDDILSVQA